MTILENNAMQSVATSAGYMTAPLVSSIPAYMLVTNRVIPAWQVGFWSCLLAIMGVLFAFPLKKRFINDEQLPFPEGYAAGVVLDSLHTSEGAAEGVFKAKLLGFSAGIAALFEILRSDKVTDAIRAPFLRLPDYWDDLIYKFYTPRILGTPLKDLTIHLDTSLVMFATGGLMGIRTGVSLFVGAVLNYCILAPIMIHEGVIHGVGFKAITMWALWGGVSMMTTASLFSFFSKPKMLLQSFSNPFKKKESTAILADIELPIAVSAVGIPIVGTILVLVAHSFFNVGYFEGIIAIPLVFVFTLIAVNSTGLTSITPGGALGKLTQLTYSVISPGNIPTNIMAAGINGDVGLSASNLLMDIKPAYMLGGKPRHQAVGHILGIFAGAACAVPVYYLDLPRRSLAAHQREAPDAFGHDLARGGAGAFRGAQVPPSDRALGGVDRRHARNRVRDPQQEDEGALPALRRRHGPGVRADLHRQPVDGARLVHLLLPRAQVQRPQDHGVQDLGRKPRDARRGRHRRRLDHRDHPHHPGKRDPQISRTTRALGHLVTACASIRLCSSAPMR